MVPLSSSAPTAPQVTSWLHQWHWLVLLLHLSIPLGMRLAPEQNLAHALAIHQTLMNISDASSEYTVHFLSTPPPAVSRLVVQLSIYHTGFQYVRTFICLAILGW